MRKVNPNPPGRNGFKYSPQFGVIVICKDEPHHIKVFETLKKRGHKVKVVAV